MKYKLYLDDLRYPDPDNMDWRIARNYHDAVWYCKNYGLPYHVAFDHDLADVHYNLDSGYGPLDEFMDGKSAPREFTGYDFAKWFCNHVLDNNIDLPFNFSYNVHSANPVGAENIRRYMESFLKDGYV